MVCLPACNLPHYLTALETEHGAPGITAEDCRAVLLVQQRQGDQGLRQQSLHAAGRLTEGAHSMHSMTSMPVV